MKFYKILIILLLATFSTYAQTDRLTKSFNEYAFDLYSQIKTDNENLFISPLSTYYALLTAYEGARNDTKIEFQKVLNIDEPEYVSYFHDFFMNLMIWRDSSNYLSISNSLWLQKDFEINKIYEDKIKYEYYSDIKTIDFSTKDIAVKEMNYWVEKKTNGLIPKMLNTSDINDSTKTVMINTIYFIGTWESRFNKEFTKPDNFYSINHDKSEIDFMNKTEYLNYYENDDFQFVKKNYEGYDKSLCIILPRKKYGLVDFEKNFTISILDTLIWRTADLQVELSIPKFKLETSSSLRGPLQKLGLEKAFTPYADFSGVTSEVPLMIDEIKHTACIEIDEYKTVAAAGTFLSERIGSAGQGPKPKIFKADHPFLFMIIENKTNGIIFLGRYVQAE